MSEKIETNKIKVVLKKPHTHQGDDFKSGETIEVTAQQQKWLKAIGVV